MAFFRTHDGGGAGLVGEQRHFAEEFPRSQMGNGFCPGEPVSLDPYRDLTSLHKEEGIANFSLSHDDFPNSRAVQEKVRQHLLNLANGQRGKEIHLAQEARKIDAISSVKRQILHGRMRSSFPQDSHCRVRAYHAARMNPQTNNAEEQAEGSNFSGHFEQR